MIDLVEHVYSSVQTIMHVHQLYLTKRPLPRNKFKMIFIVRILDKYFLAMIILFLTNEEKQVEL